MQNFLITFGIIVFAITSLTVSTNLSTLGRTTAYLKEDVEIAIHDASLQIDNSELAEGKIVFDEPRARQVFKETFEMNTGFTSADYEVLDFKVFDHSNTTFPVEYDSTVIDFKDIFLYPSIVAIVKTNTGKYFFTSEEKSVIRVTSYSYSTEGL